MKIKDLFAGLHVELCTDELSEVTSVTVDSREVLDGSLFVALSGANVDGHIFIEEAINKGATAVVVNRSFMKNNKIVSNLRSKLIITKDTNKILGILASRFYNNPTGKLKVVGVTGTNGKTTVTHLIAKLLRDKKSKVGILGTMGHNTGDATYAAKNTTPNALETQKMAHELLVSGGEYLCMEVSSHAVANHRVKGTDYDIAVFTNITQDHLDFHKTFENYRLVKGMFITSLGTQGEKNGKGKMVILNGDDPNYSYFQSVSLCTLITYGIDGDFDVAAHNIEISLKCTKFSLKTWKGNIEIETKLVGKFGVYNCLAAISVALIEGMSLIEIQKAFRNIDGVSGRFERVRSNGDFVVIVDYAHTPDGLENVLKTATIIKQNRIILVFGCGGDRDKGKRPIMAQIAEKYADFSIVTNDNPRNEDPEKIIDDIIGGFKDSKYEIILDRKKAIEKAVKFAQKGDIILIVGKGHETYQIIGDKTYEFNDKSVAEYIIRELDLNEIDSK
ncbi:UDP-N-acetylmuramoyl-L-alanyl-D-glutamate--2,6-diaminopimelate ligase [Alkalicella caledoniensis]|uniref:UDP-N-acetylmuramoyl-L-alanyl-D-glutamate--2,6-diaminopimelate ligase n=1 Tax=Alkalicella caledoniensis TaxID=2731377 RepID=A0A7G9WC89_ALKCA|nr:UDP-N-acetylmuramoyl-L-alanyl-D-glutamate--2,6-diaminopimelate ligase [Alkalicella caledoniensis]QNO16301.1 UDP-N-acetylmuramoyl-L-alanyl-D-glutamate--2,6-diaminopimelate ligase [Alkalicella caledoniensis]